jgi:hypothetical protein
LRDLLGTEQEGKLPERWISGSLVQEPTLHASAEVE